MAREIERLRSLVPPPGTWRITVHEDGTVKRVALDEIGWFREGNVPTRWWADVDPEDGAR